jgi:hypothetical protein
LGREAHDDQRFRLLYRDADGLPEEHGKILEVVMVHSGEGALMLGGTTIGKKASAATGDYLLTTLTGGEEILWRERYCSHSGSRTASLCRLARTFLYVLLKSRRSHDFAVNGELSCELIAMG